LDTIGITDPAEFKTKEQREEISRLVKITVNEKKI
jgi:hypothetical protein